MTMSPSTRNGISLPKTVMFGPSSDLVFSLDRFGTTPVLHTRPADATGAYRAMLNLTEPPRRSPCYPYGVMGPGGRDDLPATEMIETGHQWPATQS